MSAHDPKASKHTAVEGEDRALKRIARSGAANVGAAAVGSASNFLLIVLITRFWASEDAGLLFAATSFFIIAVALAHLGADQGLVRFIAWNVGRGAGHSNRATVLAGVLPSLTMTLVVAVLGYAAAPWLAGLLGAQSGAEGALIIRVLVVTLPFAVLYEQLLAVCRGYAVMKPTIVLERALRPTLQMLLILAAGLAQSGVVVLTLAWTLPYALCFLLAGVAAVRTLRRHRDDWHGAAPAAIYTAATRFLVLGQVATSALQQVSEPQLARLLARKRKDTVSLVIRQMTLWSVALVWPVYLVFAVHASALMALVFGPGYEAGGIVLQLLATAMLVATAVGPLDVLLLMAGRSSLSLLNISVALVVDLALCVLLIPQLGILGAGIAWAAAIIAKNLLCLWQVRKHLGISVFSRELVMWLISLLGLFGLLGLLGSLPPAQPWVGLGISALTGIFYLGYLWSKRTLLMPKKVVA